MATESILPQSPAKAAPTSGEGLKVAIRFRPLSESERQAGAYEAFRRDESCPKRVVVEDSRSGEDFVFHHVFPPTTSNEEVFNSLVDLEPLISGIHTTIFAYGVTGSGKTHTMLGDGRGDEGIVQRTVRALFEELARHSDRRAQGGSTLGGGAGARAPPPWGSALSFSVRVGVMQVYDLGVDDLLAGRPVAIKSCEAVGLLQPAVAGPEDTMALIARGVAARKTAATNKNDTSSRSHLLVRLTLEASPSPDAAGGVAAGTLSRLTLVDLAGSESAEASAGMPNQQQRQQEGAQINGSLLQLQRVFTALAERSGYRAFRGNRLTELLNESLVGAGARMTMICAASPARLARDRDPTLSTLRFARTGTRITIRARRNVVINAEVGRGGC
ncbi:hypothetical protein Rsub_01130 [Raphidocelis subcapitata]|uniref:Kinesin-like protein n=1 Tax=Raphidocelis subcapitata TaxID=307507 RepID=A0A2V0NLU5_9CHLO|nr:hypothetical protein Rsub_01130 [Raphidocelis subcapitata]|eukprot:GBF88418.1 hypothetical protein Rsub_01130 [Raphidocelis subcapitata]